MGFESEFDTERKDAIRAAKETVKVTAFDAFNTAILLSPVGNPELWVYKHPQRGYIDYLGYFGAPPEGYVGGRFRSNWNLSSTDFDESVTDDIVTERQKLGSLKKVLSGKYTGFYTYTNNLPYAERIDEGWSSQQPAGITDVVKMRTELRIPEIERAANKKFGVS